MPFSALMISDRLRTQVFKATLRGEGQFEVTSAHELSTQGAEGVFVVAFVDGGGDGHLRTLSGTDQGARRSGVHDQNVDTLFSGLNNMGRAFLANV